MLTLQKYDFPGNVRELENILERALTLASGDEIANGDLQLPGVRIMNELESLENSIDAQGKKEEKRKEDERLAAVLAEQEAPFTTVNDVAPVQVEV